MKTRFIHPVLAAASSFLMGTIIETIEAHGDELPKLPEKAHASLDSLTPPQRDSFGGFIINLALARTGFFHTQMDDDGKQWLVDPDGHPFFIFGVSEWSKSAGDAEDVVARLRGWGFNSASATNASFGTVLKQTEIPFVLPLPRSEHGGLSRPLGVAGSFDPFDPATQSEIDRIFSKELPARATNPLLIGYVIGDAPRFAEIPKDVPALDGTYACKRKLIELLSAKYKTIAAFNVAWSAQFKSFYELSDEGLDPKTDAARSDMNDYVARYIEAYFSVLNTACRQYDPHHLLISPRFEPVTVNNEQLCRTAGKYCDVISISFPAASVDVTLLNNVYEWCGQKPLMLSSSLWTSQRAMNSRRKRDLAYRSFTEQSASLGFVIGIEGIALPEQCPTEVTKSNLEIYDVLLRKRAPFSWDDSHTTK